MAVNGREKGNTFERLLVHHIRNAFQCDPKECFRTPLSGGHMQYQTRADITLSERMQRLFPFALEAKKWKDFHPGRFLKPDKTHVACFKQAFKNAKPEVSPLLVVRANFWPIWAAAPSQATQGDPRFSVSELESDGVPFMCFTIAKRQWVAMPWENFLSLAATNKPWELKLRAK